MELSTVGSKLANLTSIGVATSLILTGCGAASTMEPSPSLAAVRIEAPQLYRQWFAQTESCSGLIGDFQLIDWYVVPESKSFTFEGTERIGMWEKSGGRSRIVIAGDFASHEMVVRHEILHHLIGRSGHPTELFESQCKLTWESWGSGEPAGSIG